MHRLSYVKMLIILLHMMYGLIACWKLLVEIQVTLMLLMLVQVYTTHSYSLAQKSRGVAWNMIWSHTWPIIGLAIGITDGIYCLG